MAKQLRVIHYINQFFGGLGGEEKANIPVEVKEGSIGPGRVLQQALGTSGTVVATIICGDNYIVEEKEQAMKAVRAALDKYKPDVVVAGPAFEAGRYGLACAEVCREAKEQGIPAVTGMYPDNPGVITYRQQLYCVPTGTSPSEMPVALKKMVSLALKLGRGEELGPADVEGYLPRGIRKPVMREKTGAERSADMLKARLNNQPFVSEVFIKPFEVVPPAPALRNLRQATVALVTTGAVVPKGNPDKMPPVFATRYYKYSLEGLGELTPDKWESVHAGFNTSFLNTKDTSYALPLPAMRVLESKGIFKKLFPIFFSTPGVATAVKDSMRIGAGIAKELKEAGVDASLLVAT